jgi:hypothetical protein
VAIKAKMTGLKEAQQAIKAAKVSVQQATAAAMYVAGNVVMTEAKQRAPIDLGILRASGYVTLPKAGSSPVVEVGFGGAAEQYALIQHERTEFRHEVGEAKYLENAINATDIKGIIEEEIARRFESGDASLPSGSHRTEPE